MKICSKCRIAQELTEFYKYKNRAGYRPDCRTCRNKWTRKYNSLESSKAKGRGKRCRWAMANLESWKHYIPQTTKCGICHTEICFDSKDINKSIHFDHRINNCPITGSPKSWLLKHRYNATTKRLWDLSNFGMLCGRCNRSLPTIDRNKWVIRVMRYVFEDSI